MATILIVDDEPRVRKYLAKVLSDAGHRVLESANGEEALQRVDAEHPHLVITDLQMPIMDGFELVRRLRSNAAIAHTRVILASGVYLEQETHALAQACGINCLITKPTDAATLLRAVRQTLRAPPPTGGILSPESFDTEHLRLLTSKLGEKLKELEAINARFRLQIERLPLAYILWDRDGRILDWNPAAEKTFGYTKEEVLGRVALDLLVPPPWSDHVRKVLRRISAGDMGAHSVNENRTKDGRVITCQWFNTPLLEADGRFIGGISLAEDITERHKAEQRLREYYDRVQALSRQLLTVQEKERQHLARELHDEIGQGLTGLQFVLDAGPDVTVAEANAKLQAARSAVDGLLAKVRELSFDLRPAMLDHQGLLPALLWLFQRYTTQTGVQVDFKHQGLTGRLAPEVETAAYRLVQESLTNVARHASVRHVIVRAWHSADALRLQVEDRGTGFNREAALSSGSTSGLAGMFERVRLLGGQLVIESAPGMGTHLEAELPLKSVLETKR